MNKLQRAATGGVLGLVASGVFVAFAPNPDEAHAAGCTASVSKYAGNVCIEPLPAQTKQDAATIFFGCLFGAVGGTPASIGYGCFGGVVSVVISNVG